MAAKNGASKAAAQRKKIAGLAARIDKALKKVGDPRLEAELRELLGALHTAHSELYSIAASDGWIELPGWIEK